jgi:formate dehydrogenase alpha subunit
MSGPATIENAPATIDGRACAPAPGESVLAAATRIGVGIPNLCAVPGAAPEGGCRLCLVEVAGEVQPLAACHTPLRDGMRVTTASERLRALRRDVLALLVAERAPALRADPAGSEVERLMHALGVAGRGAPSSPDRSHPLLRFDEARCVLCRRCVHACADLQGAFVWNVEGRGGEARLVFGAERFAESACVGCGACVDACPSAAISDRDREAEPAPERRTRSTCGYCGVGCQVEVGTAAGRVVRIDGVREASVNREHLCAKGRYAHAWQGAPDRLTRPLLRRGGKLEPATWETALAFVAERLDAIHRAHGAGALGVLTSSRSTNEAAYLLQKLFRVRFGTNHVDCCARVCHASTAHALRAVTGTGAASACYADIERARAIVVAGANPSEAHPVLGARILQQARAGAPLFVIDPRRIELAHFAAHHLALRPGTNVALLNGLAKLLIEEGLVAKDYVAERCEGFEALAGFLRGLSLDALAAEAGVAPTALRGCARDLAAAGPALFVMGLGLSELTQGVASVRALANLALLTGAVGVPGAGLLPLRGQNNVQGNADMGAAPDLLTGYQPVADPAVRARFAALWGTEPPAAPGDKLPDMLDAARAGRLRALWVQGEDLAQSDPDQTQVLAALERLELLVVQELFLTETARRAHVVLPAAGVLEQDGSFTNAERRVQRVRAALSPPGEALPDWVAIQAAAQALGLPWRYPGPAEVLEEIARAAPALFGGLRLERLDADGIQWPCPEPDHPGTPTLHADGFLRGRAVLSIVPFVASPEAGVADFPLTLVTGRVRDQYNVGTMTRRTPLSALAPRDELELATADADALGLVDGERVRVESRWGETEVPARRSERIAPGTCFLSFHHPESHTNRLVGPQRDPESGCPEYKLTAVRLRPSAATPASPAQAAARPRRGS